MKNISLLFTLLVIAIQAFKPGDVKAQACCPDFILKDAVEICPPEGACTSNGTPDGRHGLAACKNSIHTYTVYPNDPAFTYTWTVTGGTPTSFTGNPNLILWGNGVKGTIQVFINSNNPNVNCSDSISMEVCLIDGPQANFTLSPDTVCVNTPVTFNNTSLGGTHFTWDMGDGNIYTANPNPNPITHSYSAPGTYTVTLTAKDMGAGQYIGGAGIETKIPCGCTDTATYKVVVLPGEGPTIETDCCYGTVCPGDTSYFCTPMVCPSYSWSVTGGTILPPANANCITVVWDATYSVPTTVTLQNCPGSSCPGSTTLNVPVLYPNLPIAGPNVLCLGASGTYSLPHLPGTFYKWTVSGGPYTFNDKDRNVSLVNISFLAPGPYWVKCVYNNPLAGCNGADSLLVNILPKFEIVGNETLCENDPNIFSTNSFIGQPPATWTFSPAGPVINSGQGSPSINASFPPGNYVITATSLIPGAHCNLTATKNVKVIAKPILGSITGSLQACPGTNYTYSITSNTSGSPFIWSFLPASAGTILSEMGDDNDSVVVKFNGTGPWTIQVYQEIDLGNGNFCQSVTKTLNVIPYPQPNITGNSPVCVDAVETYSVSGPVPPGGFQWSISPSQNGTILTPQGGTSVNIKWHGPATTAVITVTSCSGMDTHPVVINDPPIASVTPNMTPLFCLGDVQTLILSNPNNGYTFQWYDNNGPIGGQTSSTLNISIGSFTIPGTYSYYVIVTSNGCSAKSNIVNVVIEDCSPGGPGGGPGPGGCDVVAFFRAYTLCDQVTLINKSYAIVPASITGYIWTLSPNTGNFLPNNTSPNPLLQVTASGLYAITLTVTSSTGCISTWTEYVNVLLPTASFNVTQPICENVPATFTAIPNNPNYSYFWSFGDGATSYTAVTQHAYASAALSPYWVNLVITDEYGCIATDFVPITVDPTPVCSITAPDTAFCPGSYLVLTACTGMSSYQWYKDGNPISGAVNDTLHANKYGQYWVEVTNSFGCSNISNKMYVYQHKKPKAKITGDGYFCEFAGGTSAFPLSTVYNPNYSYNWSSIPPSGVSFSPTNTSGTWVTVNLPFALPAYYQFVVDVTDLVTGCVNSDTLCVTFYEKPPLSIISIPALDVCEGTPVTLIPNINNTSLYNYLWNNGATTPVITVSTAGFYTLTITNKATGCSTTASAGSINPKPDLSLFPIGCDYLCDPDTLHLYIPLPLNWLPPFNTYATAYPSITWLDNGVPVGTGPTLAFPAGTSGSHQFSVIVQNQFGCIDSAGVFCLENGCCDIVLEYLEALPATCPQTANGSFTIVLDPSSSGGPFTITSIPVVPPLPTTIIPGIPLTVSNLPPGGYTIIISGPTEGCSETFFVDIGHLQDECCFAEYDSLFVKILSNVTYTSDVVWDGKYYIDDNVIVTVTNGAVLDITVVDVVFGECAGIVFTNGGMLRSSNSVYRPCEVDKTWKGLRFVGKGEFDNIINECTFKNAEVALYFQQNADGVVSNNLFSNCNYGIRVEGNNTFNHPISGNRFVTEQFFPVFDCPTKYPFVNNSSTYGIYSTTSRFRQEVSHNQFINSWGLSFPKSYGIFQLNGGGILSYNTFTDLSYSIYIGTALFTTIIENNEIEINRPVNTTLAAIYIANTSSPVVEVNNNEISDNLHQFSCFSAIYIRSSSKVSVMNNTIDGFQYGIYALGAMNTQVSSNKITESETAGIYYTSKGNNKNYITCNQVKMRTFNQTRGLYAFDLTPSSEISSNCFNDSYTSMDIRTTASLSLPKIRNNFLYNYNFVGINVVGYSGNIGTLSPADPGLNTLWSNYNPAVDINSSTNITVADNFGMFNISWPTVQITSNRPFHSTASCAQQIFNMPSQGNLNVNYLCDNYKNLFAMGNNAGGTFTLPSDFRARLNVSAEQFSDAELILASAEQADEVLLNEVIGATSLTQNEEALLKYHHYYRNADFVNARASLWNFVPENDDDTDFRTLRVIDLDVIEYGWDIITEGQFMAMEMIAEKRSENSNFAISLLNNSPSYRDHLFDLEPLPGVVAGSEIKYIQEQADYLNIRPNPSSDKIYIDLIDFSMAKDRVEVRDVSGKLVNRVEVNSIGGGIEMDISLLKEGFYTVTVTDTGSGIMKTGKLIKIR
jgi:parallel beta-helix repeat protein